MILQFSLSLALIQIPIEISVKEVLFMVKRLLAEYHLDAGAECRCRHVKNQTERFVPHCHDYYEIFLTLAGSATHFVNGVTEPITAGYLIFIRKDDEHDYMNYDRSFEFINLAFSENTLEKLFDYLGEGFPAEHLLKVPLPPVVKLTDKETRNLYMKLAELNTVNFSDKAKLKLKTRGLLVHIFTTYFGDIRSEDGQTDLPFWLENAYEKMRSPKNFILGKNRFFELCGMTREHASRSLRKYYGVTPSEYVNDLRLSYAAGLFLSSNLSATDVCYECGFQNVSWFYSAFTKKFGLTPAKYREKWQQSAE